MMAAFPTTRSGSSTSIELGTAKAERAVGAVIEAACKFPGVFEIAAGNFERRLGPRQLHL